eukprot:gene1157-2246_t
MRFPDICLLLVLLYSIAQSYVIRSHFSKKCHFIQSKSIFSTINLNNEVDGLQVQRVDVPQLSEMFGKSVFYYEVVDWKWWEKPKGGESPKSNPQSAPVYVVGSFTYGAKLWPACLAVSLFLHENKNLVEGRTILDVGCGVGLVSHTASLCNAANITAADISPLTLKLVEKAALEMNINNIKSLELDILGNIPLPQADISIFADVLYSPQLGKGVAKRVAEAKARGDWVIVGSARGREGRESFIKTLIELGVTETFNSPMDDMVVALANVGWKQKEVEILEINRPQVS